MNFKEEKDFQWKEEFEVIKSYPLTLHYTINKSLSGDMIVFKCDNVSQNRYVEE